MQNPRSSLCYPAQRHDRQEEETYVAGALCADELVGSGADFALALDPVLAQRDHLLDDDPLFQAVKADLAHRRPRTLSDGRPSTPVEVILRMLVIKHLYGWS